MDKILKVTKKLKTFTLDDIVMFSGIDTNSVREFLQQSENIKQVGNKFEYLEIIKVEDKFKIIDKNIPSKNSDITVIEACEEFLRIKYKTLKPMSYQTYKTFIYAQIIPYFKTFCMKDLTVKIFRISKNICKKIRFLNAELRIFYAC